MSSLLCTQSEISKLKLTLYAHLHQNAGYQPKYFISHFTSARRIVSARTIQEITANNYRYALQRSVERILSLSFQPYLCLFSNAFPPAALLTCWFIILLLWNIVTANFSSCCCYFSTLRLFFLKFRINFFYNFFCCCFPSMCICVYLL